MRILLCFGTRTETIKMARLFHELRKTSFSLKVFVTAQHRQIVDQVLVFFEILTDSEGVQEKVPSLRKSVLVISDTTERSEALEAKTIRLLGTKKIIDFSGLFAIATRCYSL